MGVNPHKLLLIDATSHSLLLVEGPGGKVLSEVSLPKNTSAIDMAMVTPCQQAFISLASNKGSGSLMVLHLDTFTPNPTFPEIPYPSQIAPTSDGKKVYFADPAGNLYLLDLESSAVSSWEAPPGVGSCTGLVTDTNHLYGVWETPSGGVLIVFDQQNTPLREYTLRGCPTSLTLDQQGRLYVPYTTNSCSGEGVFIVSDHPTVITITCSCCALAARSYPLHVTVEPAGKLAYITCEDSASIAVVDMSSTKLIATIPVRRSISRLALLPGGKTAIASSNMFADLCLIDLMNARLISFTSSVRELLSPMAIIE